MISQLISRRTLTLLAIVALAIIIVIYAQVLGSRLFNKQPTDPISEVPADNNALVTDGNGAEPSAEERQASLEALAAEAGAPETDQAARAASLKALADEADVTEIDQAARQASLEALAAEADAEAVAYPE